MNSVAKDGPSKAAVLFSGRSLLVAILLSIPCVLLVMWLLGFGLDSGKAASAALATVLGLSVLGEWVRQRFRFGLRSLVLIMTALSILLGLVGQQAIKARRQRAAAALALELGGTVRHNFSFDSNGWFATKSGVLLPNWLRDIFSDEMFGNVQSLYLSGSRCTDQDFDFICQQLQDLEYVRISGSPISDTGVEHLRHCAQLRLVELDATQLTRGNLEALAKLPQLTDLRVSGTNIDPAAFAELPRLTSLRSFWAHGTDVSDADLKAIGGASRLEFLSLNGSLLTDKCVDHIAPLKPRLRSLNLLQTQVTDAGVRELADEFSEYNQLENLMLGSPGITDDAVDDLARIRSLRYLYIRGTSISPAGLRELEQRLPECWVQQQ